MRYLDLDTRAGHRDIEKGNVAALQSKLDAIAKEHGDTYIKGIQPASLRTPQSTSLRLLVELGSPRCPPYVV